MSARHHLNRSIFWWKFTYRSSLYMPATDVTRSPSVHMLNINYTHATNFHLHHQLFFGGKLVQHIGFLLACVRMCQLAKWNSYYVIAVTARNAWHCALGLRICLTESCRMHILSSRRQVQGCSFFANLPQSILSLLSSLVPPPLASQLIYFAASQEHA